MVRCVQLVMDRFEDSVILVKFRDYYDLEDFRLFRLVFFFSLFLVFLLYKWFRIYNPDIKERRCPPFCLIYYSLGKKLKNFSKM